MSMPAIGCGASSAMPAIAANVQAALIAVTALGVAPT